MIKYAAWIEPRRIPLFAAALIVLVTAALIGYGVLPQYNARRTALGEQFTLEQAVVDARSVTAEQARLHAEVERLELAVHSAAGGLSQQALEAFVIGRLQNIAWQRDVELVSIQPSSGRQIGAVRETLFELELAGEYADLHAWLADLRIELASVIVRQLSLAPLEVESADPRLRAALMMAAYGSSE